jgi:hypothetical protein
MNMNVQPTNAELLAMIRRLQEENEALRKSKTRALTLKVGEKGGVSLYGMSRFPVTLYASQWEKVFGMVEEIKAFIKANDADLKRKQALAGVTEA